MKRYTLYIVILLFLAAAGGAYWVKNFYKSPEELEADFAVKEASSIHSILLQDNKGKSLKLEIAEGKWLVNNKHEAREDMMQSLMESITRVSSLTPVPNSAHDNVVRDIMNEHIKVQLYNKDHKLLKSYWVGDASLDNRGTYLLMEVDGKPVSRPHIGYIPGHQGYITPRFNTDEEVWRSRIVFREPEPDIAEVSVVYSANPEKSFRIQRLPNDSLQVNAIDDQYTLNESYSQNHVKQYMDFYSSVYMEAFDNNYSKKDSLLQTVPYCTISLKTKDGRINEVKLFRMPYNKRSKTQYDLKGKEIDYDIDRFYASVNNGKDFVIVQYFVFGKLLREYRQFFYKPT